MEKTTTIKVTNRDVGQVGYEIPELGVRRQFMPRETKELTFEELEKLTFTIGGKQLLEDYLVVKDEEAVKELLGEIQPEYFYSEEDVNRVMTKGTLNEFLDCLDFSPEGVLEIIKKLAVDLPLNDVEKRDAILEKLGFDVTRAIEIKNTKYDGDGEVVEAKKPVRRVATTATTTATRRTTAPTKK